MASSSPQRPPIQGSCMPMMIYGTAWKYGQTAQLVYEALKAGFRGIDTGVGEHYDQRGVGEGIRRAIEDGIVRRSDLYIQTKLSLKDRPWGVTIPRSIDRSLLDLRHTEFDQGDSYIDCLLIHDPPGDDSFVELVYLFGILSRHFSELSTRSRSRIRSIGASNLRPRNLGAFLNPPLPPLCSEEIRCTLIPRVVQNAFREDSIQEYDAGMRQTLCDRNNFQFGNYPLRGLDSDGNLRLRAGSFAYQAFHTLTSNKVAWEAAKYVEFIADRAGVSKVAAWYTLLMSQNIVVLNGTTKPDRMREDIDGVRTVQRWCCSSDEAREVWMRCVTVFRDRISEDTLDPEPVQPL